MNKSSLAPGFLIASPPLGDPNFDRTVVLLAIHNESGALGFVINRAAPISMGEVLGFAGYNEQAIHDPSPVLVGGPVQPSSGWILRRGGGDTGESSEGDIAIDSRIRVSSSQAAFDRFARYVEGKGDKIRDPERRIVILGYSGWSAGQLENEMARGAWLPTPFDESILFDVDLEKRWERAYALLGVNPAGGISMRTIGSA